MCAARNAILSSLIFMFSALLAAETLQGNARNEKGEIVYTERHEITRGADGLTTKVVTTYFKPDGTQFARLASDFTHDAFAPDSRFEDRRFGLVIEGRRETAGTRTVYRITESKKGATTRTSDIQLKENLISGPGFDNFISQKLVKEKKNEADVSFLVLPRHDAYSFEVRKKTTGEDLRVYGIKPATLLSLFLKEIVITYDTKTGLLKKYEGLSNLPTDGDDSQTVAIEYVRSDITNEVAHAPEK